MGYRVIFGEYVIVGKQPDADSVRFRPDDPAGFDGLEGKPVRTAKDGTAQLRFQGVDAPELHYGGGRQPVAKYARNVLLHLMGFGKVRYDGLTVRFAENQVRGAILTRQTEVHGRPISYLLLDTDRAGLSNGQEIPDDADVASLLRSSLNFRMIEAGMLYYLAYDSMPEAHRNLFREAAAAARAAGLGVWVQDSTAEFELESAASIGPDGELIYPKLFRRCTDYLLARDQDNFTGSFTDWLRAAGPENDPVEVRGDRTTFADLIGESDGIVSLAEDTLDLVFVERPSIPPVDTVAELHLAAATLEIAGRFQEAPATGVKTIVARVKSDAEIKDASIGVDADPPVFLDGGGPNDKSAEVKTDSFGVLLFSFRVRMAAPGIAWTFTLTDKSSGKVRRTTNGVTGPGGTGTDRGTVEF